MDIYILRDGQEMGPFTEETTQSLLKQGSVLINDLAWQPGMPQWIPLHSVLYPAPAPAISPRPPPPPQGAANDAFAPPVADREPATAKQKAFLSYMGVSVPPDLTRDQAALLVNDTLETPSDPGRLVRWNEERLRLHPELFHAEIQAKKDNRANYFYEITQAEGADVFDRVAKAHCQVLVGFLDVHHPNWDANQHHATWDYFFPAIAEKFPQLVKKEWTGRLKYREGPNVAPELARRTAGTTPPRAGFPVGAVVRGVAVGLGILIVLYAGYIAATKKPSPAKSTVSATAKAPEKSGPNGPDAGPAPKSNATSLDLEKLFAETPPVPNKQADLSTAAGASSVAAPMTNSSGAQPSTGESTSPPLATSVPLFDPNALSVPGTSATLSLDPAAAQPRTSVVITKATEIPLRFGRAKLLPGTVVKFVSHEGGLLRVRYGNEVVAVPVASTDFSDLPAGTPPVPPPAAPSTPPTPIAPAVAPPPPPPTSLF